LGNTILIRIYGQGYITTGFVVIGVAASYLRRAGFIEEARPTPSMTLASDRACAAAAHPPARRRNAAAP
jgi:hypothetical protein